jgi:predicted amidohydrolase
LDGDSARRLGAIAARHDVWLLAGLAARDDGGTFNAAALFSPAGALAGAYRKQRLFAYGGEHASYAPGTSPFVFDVEGVRVAPFVCYDLRFPELFRAVARDVDAIVLIANWPAARRAHWDALVKARSIENLCYVVAVNRTGTGGKLEYDGGSVAYDPWGELVASSAAARDEVATVDVDPERVRGIRGRYPFLEDLPVPVLV